MNIKTIRQRIENKGLVFSALNDNKEKRDDAFSLEVINENYTLAIVCDGISQCTKGYIASSLSCKWITEFVKANIYQQDKLLLLQQAIEHTSKQLHETVPPTMTEDECLEFLQNFSELVPNKGQYDEEELLQSFQKAIETNSKIQVQTTFNVNLIEHADRNIVYYACGGDSPTHKVNFGSSLEFRTMYTSNQVSVFLQNQPIDPERIEIGMYQLRKGDELLILSDGVNLFVENNPMSQKGITFTQMINDKDFVSNFHKDRRKIDAVTDDYTIIHIYQNQDQIEEEQAETIKTEKPIENEDTSQEIIKKRKLELSKLGMALLIFFATNLVWSLSYLLNSNKAQRQLPEKVSQPIIAKVDTLYIRDTFYTPKDTIEVKVLVPTKPKPPKQKLLPTQRDTLITIQKDSIA